MVLFGDSVLDKLYCLYSENEAFSSKMIQEKFELLETVLAEFPGETAEKVMETVCAVCQEHERQAFCAGVRTGMRLNEELNEK